MLNNCLEITSNHEKQHPG